MNQFTFLNGNSKELEKLPHVREFSLNKSTTIQLNSFVASVSDMLRIYGIVDGKFDWIINHKQYSLYPGDVAIVLPGQEISGSRGVLNIGAIFQLFISVDGMDPEAGLILGSWSGISSLESRSVSSIMGAAGVSIMKT